MRQPIVLGRATTPAFPQPLSTSPRRAVLEGAAGCGALYLVAGQINAAHGPAVASTLFGALAGFWLVCWPAWRLAPVMGSLWGRIGRGILRTAALAIVLAIVGAVLGGLFFPAGHLGLPNGRSAAPVLFFFPWARLLVMGTAAIARPIRRRLRWQLTASYLAIILLTFVFLTAPASAVGASKMVNQGLPRPQDVALSLAALLRPAAGAPVDRHLGAYILQNVEEGRLQTQTTGLAGLGAVLVGNKITLSLALMGLDGKVLATAANHDPDVFRPSRHTLGNTPLPRGVWDTLRRAAQGGQQATVASPWPDSAGHAGQVIGMAPVLDSHRRAVAAVLVQSYRLDLTSIQFFALAFALFGVTTFTLISMTLVFTLGLSALFGYLFARGLTRRLEAVSRAAAAISAGDLSRRVPVKAQNEVGQLAANFNTMVAYLEETMGELQRARTQAVDALRARQELVASISHELRTPLAVVRAYLDTLLMHPAQEVAAGTPGRAEPAVPADEVLVPEATLRALNGEMDRLASLVDDLFALSRVETGAVKVHSEPTDVAALAGEVVSLMRPLAQNEGHISLTLETAPRVPLALADGDRLRQILGNLVRNAVRHTPEGGIIVVSVGVEEGWVVVAVADTGEGIAPEHLPHIFERFYRVDRARSRTSGGAGLGLAIVHEFVELMGGRVTVESQLGEGSCFRVYLPRA